MCRTTMFDSIALFIGDTNETHRVSPVLDILQIASTRSKKIHLVMTPQDLRNI